MLKLLIKFLINSIKFNLLVYKLLYLFLSININKLSQNYWNYILKKKKKFSDYINN